MRRLAILALLCATAACQTAETSPPPAVTATPAAAKAAVPVFAGLERPRAQSNRDDILKSILERKIHALDARAYRAVTVEVWGGRALLMGAVIKPEQRRKAEQTAAAMDGIVAVHNELVLAEDKALDVFAADPQREEQLRLALGIAGRAGTTVRVINGVAFLLGAVPTAEAANAMKADAGEVAGIKWVVTALAVTE